MWRAILEPALLFGSPFAAYALYLGLRRRYPFEVNTGRAAPSRRWLSPASPSPSPASSSSALSRRAAMAPMCPPISRTAGSCRGGSNERRRAASPPPRALARRCVRLRRVFAAHRPRRRRDPHRRRRRARRADSGVAVKEIDLATTATPELVTGARAQAAGLRAIPTGLAHGTVTLLADGAGLRGDDAARRYRHRWPPCRGSLRPRFRRRCARPRLHHQRACPSITTAAFMITPAALKICRPAACASSASRRNASARTICASCASSAFPPSSAKARSTLRGCLRRDARARRPRAALARTRARRAFKAARCAPRGGRRAGDDRRRPPRPAHRLGAQSGAAPGAGEA